MLGNKITPTNVFVINVSYHVIPFFLFSLFSTLLGIVPETITGFSFLIFLAFITSSTKFVFIFLFLFFFIVRSIMMLMFSSVISTIYEQANKQTDIGRCDF